MVEHAIGHLKSHWRCLDRSGGVQLYVPEKVCQIIWACAVLHNIAQHNGVPAPAIFPNEEGLEAKAINDEAHRAIILRKQVMQHL